MPEDVGFSHMDDHLDRIEDRLSRMEGKIDALVTGLAVHGERITRIETWRDDHQKVEDDRTGRERWTIGTLVAVASVAALAIGLVLR
ncbi:MAG: hypothetical protein IVW52_05220 [Acidimicrobiales bacterium]|nr:hypothetical protein [Acidimicrobiales bacterium]